ncbi:WecB/TagA/CpsF family glycosyltransferase [Nocardioides alkalitolerans]|uniref:WecB/TagA/CpsF family glycosyltransferase n=1 Tax=Nocardioides alkalitolerans TaxID=281714 RepID=UPI0004119B0B|nr:WecB/TagA/CpsF family glycosyltransferase [Nocardioides alkalitolerans]
MTEMLRRTGRAPRRVDLCGCPVDLMDLDDAVATITGVRRGAGTAPLAVASVNLDHVHHFGDGGRWHGVLEQAEALGSVRWLSLLDGAPLVTRADQLTGLTWPRLAGSDLVDPVLDAAAAAGLTVGFLGGSPETQERLRTSLATARPGLLLTGFWSPPREVLADPAASRRLAEEIRRTGTDVLVVGLGKPRQELWIAEHGHLTGAAALLAFGAVVDFLAGQVSRAPAWMSKHGLEWSYRLAQEPKRLSRRYLVDGPVAYGRLHRRTPETPAATRASGPGPFVGPDEPADITAVVVTHNSAGSIAPLVADLRRESGPFRLRVVVVDNRSTDATLAEVARHPDVIVDAGANDGYAAGINRGLRHLGDSRAVLVLNPDLRLDDGALLALWRRVWQPGVGVAVPAVTDDAGEVRRSLRFEPTALRTLGDALLGDRLAGRPTWLTETDHNDESYVHPHPVEWATGAALLLRAEAAAQVGAWDERYFLYSEEVDYLRRVREAGWTAWFEPAARVRHDEGGSGGPAELGALMAVNRVRYVEGRRGRARGAGVRAAAALGATLRAGSPEHRLALSYLVARRRWERLPAAESRRTPAVAPPADTVPGHERLAVLGGSVVLPAHNEEHVIGRALAPLTALASGGRLEVVVAANGCTDATVARARAVPGTVVLDLEQPSKVGALNAADAVARQWPRLYLDADIEITPRAVADVLAVLSAGGVAAARPPFRYDTTGASWVVRAFYRARGRLPETGSHLWGAGVYGVSRAGHDAFATFPALVADDLFVDQMFSPAQKTVVDTDPVVVRTPRDLASLLTVLRRTTTGNRELAGHGVQPAHAESTLGRTLRQLVTSATSPDRLVDAAVYAALVAAARVPARQAGWGRDESSRPAGAVEPAESAEAPQVRAPRRLDRHPSRASAPAASASPSAPMPASVRVELPTTRVI